MSESSPVKTRRAQYKFLGFLFGVLLCLATLIICMPLGGVLGLSKVWMFAVLYGLVLLSAGGIALRRAESPLAQGVLIALSVAFLLNGMCGFLLRK